jgi:hypothetical protein
MKWTIEFLEAEHYIRVNTEGRFNIKDQLRKIEEILSQEYWRPGLNILFDSTKVDFSDSSYEVIWELANYFVKNDELIGNGKVAILVKLVSDFGKGRQFEMLTDEKIEASVGIFLNEKQALRWLEI